MKAALRESKPNCGRIVACAEIGQSGAAASEVNLPQGLYLIPDQRA